MAAGSSKSCNSTGTFGPNNCPDAMRNKSAYPIAPDAPVTATFTGFTPVDEATRAFSRVAENLSKSLRLAALPASEVPTNCLRHGYRSKSITNSNHERIDSQWGTRFEGGMTQTSRNRSEREERIGVSTRVCQCVVASQGAKMKKKIVCPYVRPQWWHRDHGSRPKRRSYQYPWKDGGQGGRKRDQPQQTCSPSSRSASFGGTRC